MASVIRGSDNFDSLIHQGLGVNQTWQDVTASRALGTTYTNSTGKPIMVCISVGNIGASNQYFYINGIGFQTSGGVNSSAMQNVYFIVPNGSTYMYGTGISPTKWLELR